MIMCDGKIIKMGDLPEEVQAVNNKGFTVNRIFKEDLSGLTLKEAEKENYLAGA